jgi:hypothetical protein
MSNEVVSLAQCELACSIAGEVIYAMPDMEQVSMPVINDAVSVRFMITDIDGEEYELILAKATAMTGIEHDRPVVVSCADCNDQDYRFGSAKLAADHARMHLVAREPGPNNR